MRFLIFSDHHAHNFTYGCKDNPYQRFEDSLDVLRRIRSYALANDIRTVIFAGDLFHVRGQVDTRVFNQTFQEVGELAKIVDQVVMIPGNHDYADREGNFHSLEPFNDLNHVSIISTPLAMPLAGQLFYFVPYTESKEKLLDSLKAPEYKNHILVAHCGIQGAKVGANFVLVDEADVSYNDLPTHFHASFFGHYHRHQALGPNSWYIGATHQHNWGDSGCTRGFLDVEVTDTGCSVTHIESDAPKFIKWKEGDPMPRDTDLVRVFREADKDRVKGRVVELSTTAKPLATSSTVDELDEEIFSMKKLVNDWVVNSVEDEDDRKRLIQLGNKLLTEVGV